MPRQRLLLAIAISLAIPLLLGLTRVLLTIGLKVPLDPNEGWNAYHALAAISGAKLYPGPEAFMVNNYPPLSFYIVGAFSRFAGDAIGAGRILSVTGTLGVCGGVVLLLRLAGCCRLEALIPALVFAIYLLLFTDYVGMDDPQLLAQATQLSGLILLLRWPNGKAVTMGAAVLFAAAFFMKHNLFVLPLATVLWLVIIDFRRAMLLVASGIVLIVVGLIAFKVAYDRNLLEILAAPRSYSLLLLLQNTGGWLIWGTLPLAILLVLYARQPRDRYVIFCGLYGLLAVTAGVLLYGGAGVDTNVMFDADIALVLALGLACNRLAPRSVSLAAAITAAFVAPLVVGAVMAMKDNQIDSLDFWTHPHKEEEALSRRDIAFLRARRDPVLCDSLALCYWAGKTAQVDVFNISQQYALHRCNDKPLQQLVSAGAFKAIQLQALSPFPLTENLKVALMQRYRIDHTDDDGVFLVPK